MILGFELTMPNVGSWNGKWTGEKNVHYRSRKVPKDSPVKQSDYYYNFGDGWGANVRVFQVDGKQNKKLEKLSKGFSGYDWMIDSIMKHGKILNTNEDLNTQ